MRLNLDWVRRFFSEAESTAAVTNRGVRRWSGIAAALIFGSAIAAAAVSRHIPSAHSNLILDLEFAESAEGVRALVPADLRDAVVRALRDDSWMLIPAYWALFTATGMVLILSGGRINRAVGVIVIISITIAAACDLRENAAIAAALTAVAAPAAGPAPWALAKWLLLFTAASALSVPLLTRRRRLRFHANGTGVLFAIAGLRGLWAAAFHHAGVPSAVTVLVLALFLSALLFVWDPDFFAKPS
jgi:hypothetical protein